MPIRRAAGYTGLALRGEKRMSEKIVTIGAVQHELEVEHDGSTFRASGREVTLLGTNGSEAQVSIGGHVYVVPYSVDGSRVSFFFDGETFTADVAEKGARTRARHRDHSMAAPMPGVVQKILTAPGAKVAKGSPLVILEAMKMEHPIVAPFDGTVVSVNCREGELVQPGIDLVEMEPAT